MTLERRTPLRRGKPLKKSATLRRSKPIERGAPLARTGRLRPVSEKRSGDRDAHAEVRAAVFARDGHRCRLAGYPAGPCFGRLTFQHIRKAGAGGSYAIQNGLTLCQAHNDWVETAQGQGPAHAWGLWCRRGETLAECWDRMRRAGIVDYHWNGDPANGRR